MATLARCCAFVPASADSMQFTPSSNTHAHAHTHTHTRTKIKHTSTIVLLFSVTMVSVSFNAWQHVSRGNHSPKRGGPHFHSITAQVFNHETNLNNHSTCVVEVSLLFKLPVLFQDTSVGLRARAANALERPCFASPHVLHINRLVHQPVSSTGRRGRRKPP